MDIIILGLLMLQNCTIYEMKKIIEKNFGNISSSSIGSMQAAIKKLMGKNMICFSEHVENSINKKVYEITHEGKEHFLSIISEPMLYKEKNMELSKFFFMGFAPKSKRLELVAAYISGLQKELIRLEQIKSAAKMQPDFDEDSLSMLKEKGAAEIQSVTDVQEIAFFQLAMLDLSIAKIRFEIEWFENFKKNIG
ncbi:helix-turn-helix transcriptional regulator [Blautia schinkii]|nr:helix-turn-helix transcriptional regulator [Blautia schinkii]